MSSIKIVNIILIVCSLSNAQYPERKLQIEVLFESLCPDSIRFITKQLYPAWSTIKNDVNLKLVPFGKAASDPTGTKFKCQHGPKECQGNKILSCALHAYPDPTQQVEYVNCFMKNYREAESAGGDCASQVGFDYNIISQCANSGEGTQLQLQEETVTKKYDPSFIPTIVYNGVFDPEKQDKSLFDFIDVVCENLKSHA